MILSVLPSLLDYSFFGTALLRLVLGLVVLQLGYRILFKSPPPDNRRRLAGGLVLVSGALLVVGFLTQVAALAIAIFALAALIIKLRAEFSFGDRVSFYLLLLAAALALLTLGPGAFAIDLPL